MFAPVVSFFRHLFTRFAGVFIALSVGLLYLLRRLVFKGYLGKQ